MKAEHKKAKTASKFFELEADEGSESGYDSEGKVVAKGKLSFKYFALENDFYTEEQLRPKAQRLDNAYIEELAKKYAQQDGDESEEGD